MVLSFAFFSFDCFWTLAYCGAELFFSGDVSVGIFFLCHTVCAFLCSFFAIGHAASLFIRPHLLRDAFVLSFALIAFPKR